MKVAIASKNKGKIEEFRKLLTPLNIEVVDVEFEDVEENGTTFAENSLIKAKNLRNYTDLTILSDDSGLLIDTFNGWPGIHTAREFISYKTDREKCLKMIEIMKDKENRKAQFVSVITLLTPDNKVYEFVGNAYGNISDEIKGENGHGFDSIFLENETNKTFAQMSIDEKNINSHRAKAFKKLVEFLKEK